MPTVILNPVPDQLGFHYGWLCDSTGKPIDGRTVNIRHDQAGPIPAHGWRWYVAGQLRGKADSLEAARSDCEAWMMKHGDF